MPFCTQCGNRNPDDARFCAQCGTRLVSPDQGGQPAAEAPRPSENTATITFGGPQGAAETGERELAPADAAAVDALPRGSALLVVQRGPGAGSRFLLDTDKVAAGRHPENCEIFLDDVTVSRRHAEFIREGDGFRVKDAGSLNGTYVNRDRIDDVVLQGGDEVQIGKFRLVYFASSERG